MPATAIFGPVFTMLLLTLVVWVYLFIRRVPFIQNSGMTPDQLAEPGHLAQASPASVSNPSDNLKNLFEIPVLFYFSALYLFATDQVDSVYVSAAWVFAGFRVLHSLVHCSINIVMLRFVLYLLSTLALWFIVLRAAAHYFG
jgi:hypothetical protein